MNYILFTLLGMVIVTGDYKEYTERIDQEIFNSLSRISFVYEQIGKLEDSPSMLYDRQQIRFFDADMQFIFFGKVFAEHEQEHGTVYNNNMFNFAYGTQHYRAMSVPIQSDNGPVAYIQFAHQVESAPQYLRRRAFLWAFLSLIGSSIIFIFGIFIERRLLAPILDQQKYLERFAQHAGHELRTPLANIRSTLELAEMTNDYKKSVPEVIGAIDHMTQLLNKLMYIETIDLEYNEKVPVNISRMAENIITNFEPKAKELGINLIGNIKPDIIILGDEELVNTAVTNLVHNALKFTKSGGEVTIIIRQHKIVVRDTGIGMTMDVSNRIFERFFKADVVHVETGFGLGLALVKRIIELHHWSIDVSSVPGKGSRFTIYFEE